VIRVGNPASLISHLYNTCHFASPRLSFLIHAHGMHRYDFGELYHPLPFISIYYFLLAIGWYN